MIPAPLRTLLPALAVASAALLAACEPMPSSGSPFQPARDRAPVAAPGATGAPSEAPPDPDSPFVEDQVLDEAPPDRTDPPEGVDALFRGQLDGPPAQEPAPAPAPVPVAPMPAPPAPPTAWDGSAAPLEGGSWGVSLMATLLDVQPPRAVVALPDGSERVVQPGTFLPEHRLVVLAVGRDAIQVAHIEPTGWNSRVQTQTLRSLFRPQP